MDTTPLYGLPYPETTDGYDDALLTIPQALAEQVESSLAGFGGIAAPGSWISVGGGGGAPAFATGWANYGSPLRTVQFRKVGVEVTIRGVAANASGHAALDPIFTLPPGYHPTEQEVFWTAYAVNGDHVRVDVDTSGVVFLPYTLTSGQYLTLSGISFTID